MATTMRGGGPGKEKRGTSTSSPIIKKSPKPLSTTKTSSSSSSSSSSTPKTSSTTEGKPIPNYLKPTISSRNDPSKLPKKTVTDSLASKPTLDRRRSFDRPPPSSQIQKAIRNGPNTSDVKPFRSSSFSHKTTTTPLASSSSPRPTSSEKRLSTRKDVKGEFQSPRKSTLSNNMMRKDVNKGISSTKKPPKSVTSESSIDYETRSLGHLPNEDQDQDLVNIDNEAESLPEISEMNVNAKELGDPTDINIEVNQVIEEDPKDIIVENEDKSVVDEQETIEETNNHHPQIEDEKQDKPEDDAGDYNEDDHKESNADPTEAFPEEKEEETMEKEVIDVEEETKEAIEEKQEAITPPVVVATSAPIVATPVVKAQPAGKKENQQAYNDVIEETATKLRSKKNKVLALAGAFETVISLQDTSKN